MNRLEYLHETNDELKRECRELAEKLEEARERIAEYQRLVRGIYKSIEDFE